MPQWQDRYRGSVPGGPGADAAALAGAELGRQAGPGGSAAATPARPYGRILIFTLLDDRVADFDRLAEQAAEEVRIGEPDTLVYVIHLVPNAPMQRIFYEIYRDRAAFDSHEAQPYMQRFVAERRSCVLATNVIELRLKYAKVAPLPSPQASVPPPPGVPAGPAPAAQAQLPPGPPPSSAGPPVGARGFPGASGPQGTQRLQPLPPPRPQRPDPQRPDPQRPDPRWPDQRPERQRPDQRQVPSADRYYRG
jgi:quinol monooxygenase YgiN